MATEFLNLSTDTTLGGNNPSDVIVSSQKAIKDYVDNQSGGSVAIDNSTITKNASNELQTEAVLNMNSASGATNPLYHWQGTLAEYTAQNIEVLHPDWVCIVTDDSATIAWGDITGSISNQADLTNALDAKYDASNPNGYTSNVGTVTTVNNTSPDGNGNVTLAIPTVNNATLTITQGGISKGTFTANASSDVAIALDSGGAWGNITGTLSNQTDLQSALNDKADVDLSNMNASQTAKNTIVNWGTPNRASGVSIALTLSYQSYTCPSDGVVVIGGNISNSANDAALKINGANVGYGWNNGSGQYNTCVNAEFLVSKGDVCQFKTQVVGGYFTFYPMKGVN